MGTFCKTHLLAALPALLAPCHGPHPVPPEPVPGKPYLTYEFKLIGKYHVQHGFFGEYDHWFIHYALWEQARDPDKRHFIVGEFVETGKKVQLRRHDVSKEKVLDVTRLLRGYPMVTYKGGGEDVKGNPIPLLSCRQVGFNPVCEARIRGRREELYLQRSQSLSIEDDIAQQKRFLDVFQAGNHQCEPETPIRWGLITGTRFRYLENVQTQMVVENCYLPIGDGEYYFKATFTYGADCPSKYPEDYRQAREAFETLLHSIRVDRIASVSSARP